MPDLSGDKENH